MARGRRNISRFLILSLLALSALPMASCQRVMPVRTLPSWVRGIYIPMMQNKTTTPGLEELVTRMTQEEFLADGRVQVAPKQSADLQLVATIKSYTIKIDNTDSDNVPQTQEVNIITELKLLDPLDDPFAPGEAVADLGTITTSYLYSSDPRSVGVMVEPDVKANTMATLARQIVNKTITGFPIQLKDAPSGAVLPQSKVDPAQKSGNILRTTRDKNLNY